MNRQDRRASARAHRKQANGHGLDCGCTMRVHESVTQVVCPECGKICVAAGESALFPTTAARGSLSTMNGTCYCGADFQFTCAVS